MADQINEQLAKQILIRDDMIVSEEALKDEQDCKGKPDQHKSGIFYLNDVLEVQIVGDHYLSVLTEVSEATEGNAVDSITVRRVFNLETGEELFFKDLIWSEKYCFATIASVMEDKGPSKVDDYILEFLEPAKILDADEKAGRLEEPCYYILRDEKGVYYLYKDNTLQFVTFDRILNRQDDLSKDTDSSDNSKKEKTTKTTNSTNKMRKGL